MNRQGGHHTGPSGMDSGHRQENGKTIVKPPAVLLRDKKQKACANCRRAKLKCIFNDEAVCVRCKARKELCISYPRAHDEGWQQNVTTDLYAATAYLEYLSDVVQKLCSQLVDRGIVPDLHANGIRTFEAPERDNPWAGITVDEEDDSQKKRKRRKTIETMQQDRQEDVSQEQHRRPVQQDSEHPYPPYEDAMARDLQARSSEIQISTLPASFRPKPHDIQDAGESSTRSTLQALPVQQDLPVELFSQHFQSEQSGQHSYDYNISSSSPRLMNETSALPLSSTSDGSGGPSPVMSSVMSRDSSSRNIVHSLAGSYDSTRYIDPVPAAPNSTSSGRPDQLGGCDPRQNIVTKGLIPNDVAVRLVDFFHDNVSISLHGFVLRFGGFPYLAEGPAYITPFILSVLCWVSSLRLRGYAEYNRLLTHEIYNVLIHSPASSFYSDKTAPYNALDNENDDPLDPELGIGPEEIVGIVILAMFVEDRSEASTLASSAFRWARSWMEMTVASTSMTDNVVHFTQGELDGKLPIRRVASAPDLARIWLLCYIVDGTEAIMSGRVRFARRDPAPHIASLTLSDTDMQPNDIVLSFHARLTAILGDFLHRQDQFRSSISTVEDYPILRYARLASGTNSQLHFWLADLEGYNLEPALTRRLMMAYYFARILVNHPSVGIFANNGKDHLANAAESFALEAAFMMLETCTSWEPREDLHHLPWSSFRMITLAGGVLQNMHRLSGPTGSVYTVEEAISLLRTVSLLLYPLSRQVRPNSNTPLSHEDTSTASHGARKTAASLLSVSHDLEQSRMS